MYLIALTGGIASGKSTVSLRLIEHGAVHLDADEFARRAVDPGTAALEKIRAQFGDDALAGTGELDRARLGEIVFSDESARERLNRIVHPAVRSLVSAGLDRIQDENPDAVVVYDVPLLVETGQSAPQDHPFDLIVVVQADDSVRAARLVDQRGMTSEQARSRIAAQATDPERLAVADVVIDANGSLAQTMSQVDDLWDRVTGPGVGGVS